MTEKRLTHRRDVGNCKNPIIIGEFHIYSSEKIVPPHCYASSHRGYDQLLDYCQSVGAKFPVKVVIVGKGGSYCSYSLSRYVATSFIQCVTHGCRNGSVGEGSTAIRQEEIQLLKGPEFENPSKSQVRRTVLVVNSGQQGI